MKKEDIKSSPEGPGNHRPSPTMMTSEQLAAAIAQAEARLKILLNESRRRVYERK